MSNQRGGPGFISAVPGDAPDPAVAVLQKRIRAIAEVDSLSASRHLWRIGQFNRSRASRPVPALLAGK